MGTFASLALFQGTAGLKSAAVAPTRCLCQQTRLNGAPSLLRYMCTKNGIFPKSFPFEIQNVELSKTDDFQQNIQREQQKIHVESKENRARQGREGMSVLTRGGCSIPDQLRDAETGFKTCGHVQGWKGLVFPEPGPV